MKIYTKKGDHGETSLFGGKRLKKHELRLEAYGGTDELNSFLGLIISHLGGHVFLEDNQKVSYLMQKKNSHNWDNNEIMSKEFESVGFYLSNHPLEDFKDALEQYKTKSFKDFENRGNEFKKLSRLYAKKFI